MMGDRTVNLDECVVALAKIMVAAQHVAEHGNPPAICGGQRFEEWAGNIAAKALQYCAVPELDLLVTRPTVRRQRP